MAVVITNAVKNREQNNYVQQNVTWILSIKMRTFGAYGRETPSLTLGIRKFFLMGKI